MNGESGKEIVKDVYAGDNDQMRDRASGDPQDGVRFLIEADAGPDALARIVGILAMSNLAPSALRSDLEPGARMIICASFDRFSPVTAEFLRRKLLQLTCVTNAAIEAYTARN